MITWLANRGGTLVLELELFFFEGLEHCIFIFLHKFPSYYITDNALNALYTLPEFQ